MSREIVIFEHEDATETEQGFANCIFVYPSENNNFPITPTSGLSVQQTNLFDAAELTAFDNGTLSFEFSANIITRSGSDIADRNSLLREKYRDFKRRFDRLHRGKKSTVVYLNVGSQ